MTAALSGRAWNERHKFAVQSRLAHQQSRWHRNSYPPVFQDVDRKIGVSLGQFAHDLQVIVHARQRRVERRRFGIVLHRISLGAQNLVLVDRDYNPARRVWRFARFFLRLSNRGGEKDGGPQAMNGGSVSPLSKWRNLRENRPFHDSTLTPAVHGKRLQALGDASRHLSAQS